MVPFEFDFLWRLKQDGPSTAAEIAEILSRPQHSWPRTGRWVANQLRRLIAVGLVERCDDGTLGVYRLTDQGREYVDA